MRAAVYYSAQEWLGMLTSQGLGMGFLLFAAGLACMLLGWRLASVAVAADFLVIGMAAVVRLGGDHWLWWLAGFGAGMVLAAGAWVRPRWATTLLGALIGGYCCGACVVHLEGNPPPVVIAGVLGFLAVGALAFVVFDHLVVIITAAQGGALLIAGAVILLYASPAWYGGFRELAVSYRFFLPMMVVGPTLIGVFFQLSEIQENRSSQVKV